MKFPSKRAPWEVRFWARVQKGPGCWEWLGRRDVAGYGKFDPPAELGMSTVAHRIAFVLTKGEPPAGLHLDHLCRNRGCVNPDHLEPVTEAVNLLRGEGWGAKNARKTHCPKGHPYAGDNLFVNSLGRRQCRTCMRAHGKATRQRRKQRQQFGLGEVG